MASRIAGPDLGEPMNILLINHYAGSDQMGMEYRPFYLAREWAARGHDVTVIAADVSHLRRRGPVIRRDLQTTQEDGVCFRWLRTNDYAGNGAARVLNMMSFAGKLWLHALHIAREQQPALVICSSTYPLDIYAGVRIARQVGARLVFEVHDLWPLTPVLLGGHSPAHPFIRLLQHAEDLAYRRADCVVSILPHTRDYMVGRGMDPGKFVHIPNGVPISRLSSGDAGALPQEVRDVIARERRHGRFLVGYAGSLNMAHGVETLMEAGRILAHSGVAFLVVGDGAKAADLRRRFAETGQDNFHLLGLLPKQGVPRFLDEMDALAVSWPRSPLYRYGVSPNKIFDYMLAAKPIVQAGDLSNDLVGDAGCGVTVPAEDAAAVAAAVLRLSRLPAAERRRLGENGRRFVMEHHDYQRLADAFLDAVAWVPEHRTGPVIKPEAAVR
jgi:glycosyltransferase involved in cell wall biosynthesis